MSTNKPVKVSELPAWPHWVIDKINVISSHLFKDKITADAVGNLYKIPDDCVVADIDEYKFMPPPGLLVPSLGPDFHRLTVTYNGLKKDTLIHVKSSPIDGLVYLQPDTLV